jgi:hypothetical protein
LLQISLSPAQTQRNEEQIKFLTEKINSLVDEAEQMGIQGNVEQAQGLMKLCDQLKEEREQLRGNNENSHWQQVKLSSGTLIFVICCFHLFMVYSTII